MILDWMFLTFLCCVGLLDIYLLVTKQKTLSQRYHKLLPPWADLIVLCVILGVAWWLGGIGYFNTAMFFVILGHLMWHGD